jgi:hypothetical protein
MRSFAWAVTFGIAATAAANSNSVTFNKDVLPILQRRCQDCHRQGEVAARI